MYLLNILELIRVKDWLKNIILILPLIFSGKLNDYTSYYNILLGILLFCNASSIVYVINDIIDLNSDKRHPNKRKFKPLANNCLSLNTARICLVILLLSLILLLFLFGHLFYHICFYLIISSFYNFFIKKVAYLELIVLSIGYVVRVDAGSHIIDVKSSVLIVLSTFLLALFFISLKRLSELNYKMKYPSNLIDRITLNYYSISKLKYLSYSSAVLLIFNLTIFIIIRNLNFIFIFPLIIYFLYKYLKIASNSILGEDPLNLIFENKRLIVIVLICFFYSIIIYY